MPHLANSHISNWTPDELPDLSGKRMIITGGNSGIVYETAKILAAGNADAVNACRNEAKGKQALAKFVNMERDGRNCCGSTLLISPRSAPPQPKRESVLVPSTR